MEDLNEMQSQQNGSPDCPQENVVSNEMPQENVNNEELQPAAEQPAPVAVDNDTNTGAEPEPGNMPEANNEESPETNTNEEPETDYSAMSREELLAALNELLEGDITFRQHPGGHEAGDNWGYFLDFFDKYVNKR